MLRKEAFGVNFNNNVELPDNDTLKKVASIALDLNGTKLRVDRIDDVKGTPHPTLVNTVVLEFSATLGSSNDDSYPVSVLVKKSNADTHTTELQAYATLFQDLQPNQKGLISANTRGTLYNLIPRPFLVQKPYIFLENLESTGFRTVNTKLWLNLDFNHCLLAVEALAKFHASSYHIRRQLGPKGTGRMEMLQKYPFLSQKSSVYSPAQTSKLGPLYEHAFELALKVIESENPSLAFKLRRKVDPAIVFDKVVKFLEEEKYENDDFYVACHGNLQPDNVIFKYGKSEPVECRLTSFDSVFFGPMASDLTSFLLTWTTFDFRVEFEEKLLAFYCDAFEEQLLARNHNIPLPDFDIEEFHRKVERQYMKMLEFAFYNACVLLPLHLFRIHKSSSNHGGNEEQFSASIKNLLSSENKLCNIFSGKHAEFENFVLDSPVLKVRLVDILKQLAKCRVLM